MERTLKDDHENHRLEYMPVSQTLITFTSVPALQKVPSVGFLEFRGSWVCQAFSVAMDGIPVLSLLKSGDWMQAPPTGQLTLTSTGFVGSCTIVWHPNRTALVTAGAQGT